MTWATDHISPSSIESVEQCVSKWFAKYIDGLISPTSFAQAQGLAMDQAMQSYHSGGDPVTGLWLGWAENVTVPAPEDAYAICLALLGQYTEKIKPKPDDEVQVKIDLPIPGLPGITLRGYVDLSRDWGAVLVDHKVTASKRWTQEYSDNQLQATAYLWAAREAGAKPDRFVYAVFKTREGVVEYITTHRTEEQLDAFPGRCIEAYQTMQAVSELGPTADSPGILTRTCPKGWCDFPERCFPPPEARLQQLAERGQSLFGGHVVEELAIKPPEPQRLHGTRREG